MAAIFTHSPMPPTFIVNVEAISDPGDVDLFFSGPVFCDKFEQLNAVSSGDVMLPPVAV
ncbi:hypothetical protein [Sphingomonas sp. OK281]|uniref:hypothetical protein n=1 Tax=Sphingomonas sp. OK281 TaxID=1881067 RepID=UPI0015876FD9|nr:hypothetical protein [Sphingomonas sp. OK281]